MDRAVQDSHSLRAEPGEPRCKNQTKPIQSVLSVPLPFLPSHIFHHYSLGQQTSNLVRQSVRQGLVYVQCCISLCNSGSGITKNKFSSHLPPLNMYCLKMLGWLLLAQFCWNAILSRQQREEGSRASTLWPSGHVCDSVWKITADRESEQDIIKQEISCLGHTSPSYLGQGIDPSSTQPLLSHSCTCSCADPDQTKTPHAQLTAPFEYSDQISFQIIAVF